MYTIVARCHHEERAFDLNILRQRMPPVAVPFAWTQLPKVLKYVELCLVKIGGNGSITRSVIINKFSIPAAPNDVVLVPIPKGQPGRGQGQTRRIHSASCTNTNSDVDVTVQYKYHAKNKKWVRTHVYMKIKVLRPLNVMKTISALWYQMYARSSANDQMDTFAAMVREVEACYDNVRNLLSGQDRETKRSEIYQIVRDTDARFVKLEADITAAMIRVNNAASKCRDLVEELDKVV
jgi:hypothetical protein